jgi:hypothetical protein
MESDMEERREIQRTRVLKGAKIIVNQQGSVVDCTIRNLTNAGACLEVATCIEVPANFDLRFAPAQPGRKCRVVWRRERRLGISFEQ